MTYEELISEIDELTRTYHAFAIAIDGATYAGKRSLAQKLSKKYGAPVIHMSDFRLPEAERSENWRVTPAADMDFERFNEEIATPWLKGRELVYSIIDEATGEIKERLALPNAQVYIIEGTYCLHPSVFDFYDLRLFCPSDDDSRRAMAAAQDQTADAEKAAVEERYIKDYMVEEILADYTMQ